MEKFFYPKLHNAMWPGLVGKGKNSEPELSLDTLLELTTAANVDGIKFDGIDLYLYEPHLDIDISDDSLEELADKVTLKGLVIGSVVAPVWKATGGGSAMGSKEERTRFIGQVRKACRIAKKLSDLGVRPYGVIRIDSSCTTTEWTKDPKGNQSRIAETFRHACAIAEDHGEKLAAEGEICWGGMHNWKDMVELLEMIERPNMGFQADMAHTLMYLLGDNAPEYRILPHDFDWSDQEILQSGLRTLCAKLRPWTIDLHIAQNDATVHGAGSHDKTGRHCLVSDPRGKLNIPRDAGHWLRDETGRLTKAFKHICWDGCMFPNSVLHMQQTWNDILKIMIKVREAHGWNEE
jgi:sugar phosphate isomerase/epimerase